MTKISYNHAKVPHFARLTGTSPNSVNLHIHLWNDFNNKAGSFVRLLRNVKKKSVKTYLFKDRIKFFDFFRMSYES